MCEKNFKKSLNEIGGQKFVSFVKIRKTYQCHFLLKYMINCYHYSCKQPSL